MRPQRSEAHDQSSRLRVRNREAARFLRAPGVAAGLVLVVFLQPWLAASQKEPGDSRIEEVVERLVSAEALSRGVPGVAVAVVVDGRILLQRGYGIADVASDRRVTEDTPFNIASVTKPFTAALVLALAKEGRIRLDRAASTYVALPAAYRGITSRDLLTHTSGIARDLRRSIDDDPDADEYRARLARSRPVDRPGAKFEYSNTGYTILGWIVERIEEDPLETVLRRRIFEPLGMRHARYRALLSEDPERARPHVVIGGSPRPTRFNTGGFGSGGVSLSASDLAALGVGLQTERFLDRAQLQAAWTPGRLANGRPVSFRLNTSSDSYGLGWFLTRMGGHQVVTHGGGINGYSANLSHLPRERVTIGVLANAKSRDDGAAPVDPLARRIVEYCVSLKGDD
jgi:CubicO group peptidase (beta-lactamase class C family)